MTPFKLIRQTSLVLLCSVSLNGCFMIGPDYIKPEPPLPESWLTERNQLFKTGNYTNWWKLFNDPVMDQLIESAYDQNLNLQIAAIRILEARAQLGIAQGGLFPQHQAFNSSLLYNKTSGTDSSAFGSFGLAFDALWEVDLWGRFRRGIQSAQATVDMSLAGYDDVLISLMAEVATHYVQIRTLQQRLRIAKENIVIQDNSLRIANALFKNGLSTELDKQQAKSLLYGTKALVSSLKTGLQHAMNGMSILLGRPPGSLTHLLNSDIIFFALSSISFKSFSSKLTSSKIIYLALL